MYNKNNQQDELYSILLEKINCSAGLISKHYNYLNTFIPAKKKSQKSELSLTFSIVYLCKQYFKSKLIYTVAIPFTASKILAYRKPDSHKTVDFLTL